MPHQAYEAVIGLEVHAQLATSTKAFCTCKTAYGAPPNTQVCPVCLGLPGALPVLNGEAVRLAVRTALALSCTIRQRSRFARKVGSSRVDLQACKLEYSIVSPK